MAALLAPVAEGVPSDPVVSTSPEEFASWRAAASGEVASLLGDVARIPEGHALDPRWLDGPGLVDGLRRGALSVRRPDGTTLLLHISAPENVVAAPVVVLLHGHGREPMLDLRDPATGVLADEAIARAGWVVLRPVLSGFAHPPGVLPGEHLRFVATTTLRGELPAARYVRDARLAIRMAPALSSLGGPAVRDDRVVVAGHSAGAMAALLTSIVEPDVSGTIVQHYGGDYGAAWSTVEHCACGFPPPIVSRWNPKDLLAMLAPRPLLVVLDPSDPNFPMPDPRAWARPLRSAYEAAGARDALGIVTASAGHVWLTAPVLPWLATLEGR